MKTIRSTDTTKTLKKLNMKKTKADKSRKMIIIEKKILIDLLSQNY